MSKQLFLKLSPPHQVFMLSKQLKKEAILSLDKALCYGLQCNHPGSDCRTCYLSIENKSIGLEYIVKQGYVTKAEALEFTLRLSK